MLFFIKFIIRVCKKIKISYSYQINLNHIKVTYDKNQILKMNFWFESCGPHSQHFLFYEKDEFLQGFRPRKWSEWNSSQCPISFFHLKLFSVTQLVSFKSIFSSGSRKICFFSKLIKKIIKQHSGTHLKQIE